MKKFIAPVLLALLVATPLSGFGQASVQQDPAYLPIDKAIDLKTIQPEVDVNLPHFLLKDALAGLAAAGTNSPLEGLDIADLIKDTKLIRVVVINANQTNRAALEKGVKELRSELEKKWTTIVSVPEDNVGFYAMSDASGDSTAGLAFLVLDGGDAVIGNIVGHVSISKLIQIASQSKKFPKDFLQKLQGFDGQSKDPSAKKSGDASNATPK
jgi:hypothetical protein